MVVGGLLLAHWVVGVSALRDKSTMFDEIAHLTAGYSYWRTEDFRLQPEGGMVPQRWAGLPLLVGGYRFPSLDQEAWWKSDAYSLGYLFFYEEGNDVQAMLLRARAMMALLSLPLGILVYAWSRRLFGPTGAVVSLVAYAFCPTMLAHAPLVNSDLTATLFFTASIWALWAMLHRVTAWTVLRSALLVAGLFLSKNSSPFVLVMAVLLMAVRLAAKRPLPVALGAALEVRSPGGQLAVFTGAALAHAVVVLAVIWAAHDFRYSAFRTAEPGRDTLGWETVVPIPAPVAFAREHRLLPESFLYAYAYALHYAQSRRAFLNGSYSVDGFWTYFPYSLAVKTPLPLFALLILAAAGAAARRRAGGDLAGRPAGGGPAGWLDRTAPLWILLAVYWAAMLRTHLNAGHRHLLPTYPAMFILAGGAGYWLEQRWQPARVLVVALLALFVGESLARWPDYLAYFNQLAGGPRQGYRHLVDSSLDWGQDLPGLKRWLDRHGLGSGRDGTPVYLSYFGTGKPAYYGIEAKRLPGYFDEWRAREAYPLRGGVYCISATMLQAVFATVPGPWAVPYEESYQAALGELRRADASDPETRARMLHEFATEKAPLFEQLRFARLAAYLRRREPDDHVGYSILIYRLSDDDVRRALLGPPPELIPEPQLR